MQRCTLRCCCSPRGRTRYYAASASSRCHALSHRGWLYRLGSLGQASRGDASIRAAVATLYGSAQHALRLTTRSTAQPLPRFAALASDRGWLRSRQ